MVTKRKVDKEIPRPPSIKLRDYFAALAMQGIIVSGIIADMDRNDPFPESLRRDRAKGLRFALIVMLIINAILIAGGIAIWRLL